MGLREGGWSGDPNFFLHISFTKVNIRLHTKNHRPMLPGSALKVCVVGGGWWWWWWWVVVVVCKPILVFHFGPNRFGFKLLTFDLDQAEQLSICRHRPLGNEGQV